MSRYNSLRHWHRITFFAARFWFTFLWYAKACWSLVEFLFSSLTFFKKKKFLPSFRSWKPLRFGKRNIRKVLFDASHFLNKSIREYQYTLSQIQYLLLKSTCARRKYRKLKTPLFFDQSNCYYFILLLYFRRAHSISKDCDNMYYQWAKLLPIANILQTLLLYSSIGVYYKKLQIKNIL